MCLITEGIAQDSCEVYSVGGNNRVWLINKSQVEKIFYNTDGSIADIVLKETAPASGIWRVIYPVKAAAETATANSALVVATGRHFLHRVALTIPLVTQESLNLLKELGLGNFFAIVESKTASEWPNFTNENKFFFVGGKNGMNNPEGDATLGLAVGDGQTIPVAISGAQTEPISEIRLTYAAVQVDPTTTVKGQYPTQEAWITRLLDSSVI